jgi:hypothetical protein
MLEDDALLLDKPEPEVPAVVPLPENPCNAATRV